MFKKFKTMSKEKEINIEDGNVLYLNVRAVFSPCEKACAQHKTLSQNLTLSFYAKIERTLIANEESILWPPYICNHELVL